MQGPGANQVASFPFSFVQLITRIPAPHDVPDCFTQSPGLLDNLKLCIWLQLYFLFLLPVGLASLVCGACFNAGPFYFIGWNFIFSIKACRTFVCLSPHISRSCKGNSPLGWAFVLVTVTASSSLGRTSLVAISAGVQSVGFLL